MKLSGGDKTKWNRIKSELVKRPFIAYSIGWVNDKTINDIDFSMVVKINKHYEVKTIKLNELMTDLAAIINHFEGQLTDQLKEHEPMDRHINDLIITMFTKKF